MCVVYGGACVSVRGGCMCVCVEGACVSVCGGCMCECVWRVHV